MTGPGFSCEPPAPAGPGTEAMRRLPATGGRRGAGSPGDPREQALAGHKPCPVVVCPAPVRKPVRSLANPPVFDHGSPDGSDPDHDTVLCTRCGARPAASGQDIPLNTGEDVGAPPPHEAYANAPDLRREMHRLLALGAERDGRQARISTVAPVDAAVAERAWLLRRAALMDRMALESPDPGPAGAAARTAEQLLRHDRRRPDLVAGPYRPDTITTGPGCRRYVRQEYAAWTAAGAPESEPIPTRQEEGETHESQGDRTPARSRSSRPAPLASPPEPGSHR